MQENSLRVLITNHELIVRAGTQLYVLDLALELRRRGHQPLVYSPRLGAVADEIRRATIPVVDRLEALGAEPDIVHGQHHVPTMAALTLFPDIPAVYFCHGWLPWEETPPRHPRILHHVAVSEATFDRLVFEHGIPAERVTTVPNFVDVRRFNLRPALPATPQRALVFDNQARDGGWTDLVREACRRWNIAVEVVGHANGNWTAQPERLLPAYDIVFARGRAALEAMAVGAAVICCGVEGCGPIVDPENFAELRRHNFGIRVLTQPVTVERLGAELQKYRPDAAAEVARMVRSGASLTAAVDQVTEIYRRTLAEWQAMVRPGLREESCALSGYLAGFSTVVSGESARLEEERALWSARLDRQGVAFAAVSRELSQARAELAEMRNTATFRLHRRLTSFPWLVRAWRFIRKKPRGATAAMIEPFPSGTSEVEPGDPPALAVIVMSLGTPTSLVDAVRSVLRQGPVELVVVNSGGGNPAAALRAAGLEVRVLDHPGRLLPGAVRNLGIVATSAPYVAFLSADSVIEPGWVVARLERHRKGEAAVSSAVTTYRKRNLWSWVTYVNLLPRRMPGTPSDKVVHYGLSYQRTLFDRFGLFREDLQAGEDSEFNDRLAGRVPICWAPEVSIAHRDPTGFFACLGDQYARGARMVRVRRQLSDGRWRFAVARDALARMPRSLSLAWQATSGWDRLIVMGAALFSPLAVSAYAMGALCTAEKDVVEAPSLPPRPRILAALVFHNEMKYLPGWFANVPPQVDGVIALDDGSTDGSGDFVVAQPSVLELIRLPRREPHVWDEPGNRRRIIEVALRRGAEWILVVDADERLEMRFRERANAELTRAKAEGIRAYRIRLRELWGSPDRWRSDGIWSKKCPVRFFAARLDHQFDERPLHGCWAPLNSRREGDFEQSDLIVYHLRMIEAADRLARQARYQSLDPEGRFQESGYHYLTDESGLQLKGIEEGRGYEFPAPNVPI